MAFSETIKKNVRRKSHLSCCLCKKIGIEIHHIIPQEESGSDTEDNAAPLCPSCHEIYGANKTKRKFIKESRDLWYEICDKRYAADSDQFEEIRELVSNNVSKQDMNEFRNQILADITKEITQSTAFIVGKAKTEDPAKPVFWSIDEVIRYFYSLSPEQYGIPIVNWGFLYYFIFCGDMHDEEYELTKKEFLHHFGHAVAKKLCLYVLIHNKDTDFISNGFTDEEMGSLCHLCYMDMIMILSHEDIFESDLSLKLSLTNDNRLIGWSNKALKRKQQN